MHGVVRNIFNFLKVKFRAQTFLTTNYSIPLLLFIELRFNSHAYTEHTVNTTNTVTATCEMIHRFPMIPCDTIFLFYSSYYFPWIFLAFESGISALLHFIVCTFVRSFIWMHQNLSLSPCLSAHVVTTKRTNFMFSSRFLLLNVECWLLMHHEKRIFIALVGSRDSKLQKKKKIIRMHFDIVYVSIISRGDMKKDPDAHSLQNHNGSNINIIVPDCERITNA